MKSLLAFISVLSINVASAELVVYEGATTVYHTDVPLGRYISFPVAVGNQLRFRIILDRTSTAPIRDLDLWLNDVPVLLPSVDADPADYIGDLNRIYGDEIEDILWWRETNNTDGMIFDVELVLKKTGGTGIRFFVYSGCVGERCSEENFNTTGTGFTITPLSVVNLLQDLRTASEGVGPGKSLANKVILAQTYYAVPDLVSTCAVLADYVQQTAHKKVPAAQGVALAEDAGLITSAIGCQP